MKNVPLMSESTELVPTPLGHELTSRVESKVNSEGEFRFLVISYIYPYLQPYSVW